MTASRHSSRRLLTAGLLAVAAAGLAAASPPDRGPQEAVTAAALADPGPSAATRRALLAALADADEAVSRKTRDLLLAALRLRLARLPAPDRAAAGSDSVLDLAVLDPTVVASSPRLQRVVADLLATAVGDATPPGVREDLLARLDEIDVLGLDERSRVARAWQLIARAAGPAAVSHADAGLSFDDDTGGRIAATLYSLPSTLIPGAEAERFLAAVRAAVPDRALLALVDLPQARRLADVARRLGVRLLPTYGRVYSPWPRDPLTFARDRDGRVVVLVRPNLQRSREADATMGEAIVETLPADLDRAWGGVRWASAPLPFHNGQILRSPTGLWLTIHSLEPHILRRLGLDRVPVQSFSTARGIDAYLGAARSAAAELGRFYGRPPRFLHALPESGTPADRSAAMSVLGGGAGWDLDSIVTVLPADTVLVGDPNAGTALLRPLGDASLAQLRAALDLGPPVATLRTMLLQAGGGSRAQALAGFLDRIAEHLATQGMRVRRLPLLVLPPSAAGDAVPGGSEFLVGWNNVVLESAGGRTTAEGFSSGIPEGDRLARETFAAAGVELRLFPPLAQSVLRGGGYRCASNSLRAPRASTTKPVNN